MYVDRIPKIDWAKMSEKAHLIAFSERKDAAMDRIDFALIVAEENQVPCAYVQCRETDSETIYWQFGGSFPGTKDTIKSFRAMELLISWCSERYKRITTLVENTNTPMLRLWMKHGGLIIGSRTYKGSVLLEHLLEFNNGS